MINGDRYRLREAYERDIEDIMTIEFDAFADGIRENKLVFLERIGCYPEGFVLLEENNPVKHSEECETLNNGAACLNECSECSRKSSKCETCENCETIGYFCSELWDLIPENHSIFTLGHSASKCHRPKGTVLYISSYGILSSKKGMGLGKEFFRETVKHILNKNENVKHLVLLVNEEWKGAMHIYNQCGFMQYDTIKNFFEVKEGDRLRVSDGYLMKCTRETFLENVK